MKNLVILFFLFIFSASAGAESSLFYEANQNYRQGNFQAAISGYEKLLEGHPSNAALYYNLANSYYRNRNLGKAILFYEKSLLYEPRNADARRNLKYVQGSLEYRIEDKRNWYLQAGEAVLKWFTAREIYLVSAFFCFFFLASWVFVIFFRRGLTWGGVRKTFLFLSILSLVFSGIKHLEVRWFRDCIVMAKEAEVRYGPSESDKVALRLGEGLKVYGVEAREGWSRILLTNGESGWVKDEQIEKVI